MQQQQRNSIRHYFYSQIRSIVEDQHLLSYKLLHQLNLLLCGLFISRFFHISYYLLFEYAPSNTPDHLFLLRLFHFHSRHDILFVAAAFIMMGVSSGLLEARLYLAPGTAATLTWQMFYDFVVRGKALLEQCRRTPAQQAKFRAKRAERMKVTKLHLQARDGKMRQLLLSFRLHLANVLSSWCCLEVTVSRRRLAATRLLLYGDMSLAIRFRLAAALRALDYINCLIICSLCKGLFISEYSFHFNFLSFLQTQASSSFSFVKRS